MNIDELIKKYPNDSDLGKKVRAQGKQAIEETDITYTHSATCENDTSCFEFYVLLDSDMNREKGLVGVTYTDKITKKEYHWDNNLWLNSIANGGEFDEYDSINMNDLPMLRYFLKELIGKEWL